MPRVRDANGVVPRLLAGRLFPFRVVYRLTLAFVLARPVFASSVPAGGARPPREVFEYRRSLSIISTRGDLGRLSKVDGMRDNAGSSCVPTLPPVARALVERL